MAKVKKEMAAPSSVIDQLHNDFLSLFKIEKTEVRDSASWQYFSNKQEFENRIAALTRLTRKNKPRLVCGVVKINEENQDQTKPSTVVTRDKIAKFEDFLIKHIRVSRNYTPRGVAKYKRRKIDNPNYTYIRGKFDLACSTPSTATEPHVIEFVLYRCPFVSALKKKNLLISYARDIGLNIEIKMSRYSKEELGA